MAIRTHSLFHFTEELTSLQSILKTGVFWPRYSLEDLSWVAEGDLHLAFPIVSFCDIPISRIEEHTAYYGQYGIGLTQEWGKQSGLNPLLYVNEKSVFAKRLYSAALTVMDRDKTKGEWKPEAKAPAEGANAETAEDLQAAFEKRWSNFYDGLHLLSYTKPMTGYVRGQEGAESKNFYAESEWRYIPSAIMTTSDCYLPEKRFRDVEAEESKRRCGR